MHCISVFYCIYYISLKQNVLSQVWAAESWSSRTERANKASQRHGVLSTEEGQGHDRGGEDLHRLFVLFIKRIPCTKCPLMKSWHDYCNLIFLIIKQTILQVETLRAKVAEKDMFITELLDRIAIVECEVRATASM